MIARDAPAVLKFQFWLCIGAFILCGIAAAWLGLRDLAPAVRATPDRVPIVIFHPFYTIGVPLAVAFLALAILGLRPSIEPAAGRRKPKTDRSRVTTFIFGIVLCAILASTITSPIARWLVSDMLLARGYRECPVSVDERRPPMRFASARTRCP